MTLVIFYFVREIQLRYNMNYIIWSRFENDIVVFGYRINLRGVFMAERYNFITLVIPFKNCLD